MKELEERILREGRVLPGDVLKVGSFLNHQIDAALTMRMGGEIAGLYSGCGVTRVLTVETSGIPLAFCAAFKLGVPMVFAKKNRTSNLSGGLYQTVVHSYTHNTDYTVVVEKQFLSPGDRVLIVDDFLANGKALQGLRELVQMAGAEVVGAAVAIEKGFQPGGAELRASGMRVESLAVIDSLEGGKVSFRG